MSVTAPSRTSLLFKPSPREKTSAARLAQALSSSAKRPVSSTTFAIEVILANCLKTPLGSGRARSLLISAKAGKEVPSLIRKESFCLIVCVALLAVAMLGPWPSDTVRLSGLTIVN